MAFVSDNYPGKQVRAQNELFENGPGLKPYPGSKRCGIKTGRAHFGAYPYHHLPPTTYHLLQGGDSAFEHQILLEGSEPAIRKALTVEDTSHFRPKRSP